LTRFILNQKEVNTALSPSMLVLDMVRYHERLTGTKIGCREGDCGACTVLVGEIKNGELVYSSATSCLMAIGNAQGKHIVTIEGINLQGLNAVQEAFAEEGATQCGFCTPGFIVSLAGFCISEQDPAYTSAINAVNGNICRCTGYKSIERAAARISDLMQQRGNDAPLQFAIDKKIIPAYFLDIKERLVRINNAEIRKAAAGKFLGGGTDLYVQQPETMPYENVHFLFDKKELKEITQRGDTCRMGGAVTVSDMATSPVFIQHFPRLQQYIKLISSTQIRNMATVGGNFTNASPIGDLTVFFLALDAKLLLGDGITKTELPLRRLYKGYKTLEKSDKEYIEQVIFELPGASHFFNFEKVSKRTCLDIASVNSAIHLVMEGEVIVRAGLSAGGVGPIPLYLSRSSTHLAGKKITAALIEEVIAVAQTEISPISDARGSDTYKRLLLGQLIKAHFLQLFPSLVLPSLTQASA
jgi:xanthine dehydrogenase small subunit